MAGQSKRGPASVPAQPDITVTITLGITADRGKANTVGVDVHIDCEGSAYAVQLLREAEARGELRPAVGVAIDAIAKALGGYSLGRSVVSRTAGRA